MLAPEPNMIGEYLERRRANRLGRIPFVEGSKDPEPRRTVGILGFIQGAQDGYNYNKKGETKMRDIKIKPVLNGWIVNVGCCDVVFDNMEKMLRELKYYILDPEKVEASYLKNAVNQLLGRPEVVERTTPVRGLPIKLAEDQEGRQPEPKLPDDSAKAELA